VGEFDFEAMARKAAEDAVNSIAPQLIPIGEYEAVFTPATLSTFTGFMGQLGFSARAYQDGYSCLTDRIGSQVFDHALPKSGRFFFRGMPLPLNMVVEPGEATVEEMIEDTKRGVYLTRLHYVNAIRRDLAVISGLTRDACWLIEDGEVKHPIKVMRFTDSVIRVMSGIDAIGGESTVRILPYGTLPAVKVSSFRFTGQSEF